MLLLLCGSGMVRAQSVGCKILYAYDAKGNRIKREYYCTNPPDPNAPYPWDDNNTLLSNLYPNPTTGMVTGVFSVAAGSATVSVFSMSGSLVFQQIFGQQLSMFTVNLSGQVPGTYLLTVATPSLVETYTLIKIGQ